MATFKIGGPASPSGFDKGAHEGCLLAFVQPSSEQTTTSFGDAEAARLTFVWCLDEYLVYSDVLVFGQALVPRLVDTADEIVVGRLERGEAKPGRNAPWLLSDPTLDEVDKAQGLFESFATKLPSGKIVVDTDAIAAVKPPDPEPF